MGLWIGLLILPCEAAILNVGPGQDYLTVAEAMTDAESGDEIVLEAAVHDASGVVLNGIELTISGGYKATLAADQVDASVVMFTLLNGARLVVNDLDIDARSEQAFWVEDSTLETHSVSVRNGLAAEGGALYALRSDIAIYGGDWEDNVASARGGDAFLVDTIAFFDKMDLNRGQAPQGGSVWANGGITELLSVTIDGAQSADAAAVYANQGQVELSWSTIRNTLTTATATVFTGASSTNMFGTRFQDNVTTDGPIVDGSGPQLHIEHGRFEGNITNDEIVLATASDSMIRGTLYCLNNAGTGMARFASPASGGFHNNVVMNNTSGQWGMRANGVSVTAHNNHFLANFAALGGSAIGADAGGSAVAVNNLIAWAEDGDSTPVVWTDAWLTFDYALMFSNGSDDVVGENSFTEDPGFARPGETSCTVRPVLPPDDSPVVDAGDPGILDQDGTRSDIGAFGGEDPFDQVEWLDQDEDGFNEADDCDDEDPNVNPKAREILCDGIDNDCSAETPDPGPDVDADGVGACWDCDDQDPTQFESITGMLDLDLDGFGSGESVTTCSATPIADVAGDCDDNDASVFPGADEVRDDGIDQDCDGKDIDTSLGGAVGVSCSAAGGPAAFAPVLLVGLLFRRRRTS